MRKMFKRVLSGADQGSLESHLSLQLLLLHRSTLLCHLKDLREDKRIKKQCN